MNSLNFGENSSSDKYNIFLQEYLEYENDNLSVSKAQSVASTGWHLTDWTFQEFQSTHNFNDLGDYRKSLFESCQSLKIMHDLTNASKHMIVTRPKGNIQNTNKHLGTFSNEFSDEFDISFLEIKIKNGPSLSFVNEIKKVKDFWDNYFGTL